MPDVGAPETEEEEQPAKRGPLAANAPKLALVAVFVALFLTVGVPRFLAGDTGPQGSSTPDFETLCRDHGGTPQTAENQPVRCTVKYGNRVYVMDAITPDGFDEDTARFQRTGCEQAAQQELEQPPGQRRRFVYHADTGVCERRP
jgi:hypothetical protein